MATDNSELLLGASPGFYDNAAILLDLAKYHFPETQDESQLKVGVVGYSLNSMTKAISENALMRSMDSKESFLNTASTPGAILTFAKQYEYDVGLAKAPVSRILLGLPVEQVRLSLNADNMFTLSKDQALYIDNIEFLLPADVNIYINADNSINVKYNLASSHISLSSAEEYIRTYTAPETIGTNQVVTMLYMELKAYQMAQRVSNFRIISSDNRIENLIRFPVSIPSGTQLAEFEVYYRAPTETNFVKLEKLFNEKRSTTSEQYCFYTYEGGDTGIENLVIYFSSSLGAFRPEYNSELQVVAYTTTGTAGNFNYLGQPVFIVPRYDGAQMFYASQMITSPSGGKDRESLMQIKQGCLKKNLYRENIVIESDLATYLNDVVSKEQVNGSEVEFIKLRDDVIVRLFRGYLRLVDSNGFVIPTNTADISIDYDKLVEKNWVIKPGDVVVYDKDANRFRFTEDYEYPINFLKDSTEFVYCVPYYVKITKTPFPSISYIRNDINSSLLLTTEKTFDSIITQESFIVNSIQTARNSVFEDRYLVTMNINSTLNETNLASRVVPRLSIKTGDGTVLGYTDLRYESNGNFVAVLNTNDAYNDNIELQIINSLYNADGNLEPIVELPEDIYYEIQIYFNSAGGNGTVLNNVAYIEKDGVIYQLVQLHRNSETPVNLFKKLDGIMSSTLVVQDNGLFNLEKIPLVGASFYLNASKFTEINSIMDSFQIALDDAFSLLQNNTSVDIKLYNTYGISSYFNIDRTNMSMYLLLKANKPTEDLKNRVKSSIVKFISAANTGLTTEFNWSNLNTYLETTYKSEISAITFKNINGNNIQSIAPIYSKTYLEQDNSRIPEFLNISTRINQAGNYEPEIRIDFI